MAIDFNQYLKDGKLDLFYEKDLFKDETNINELAKFISKNDKNITDLNLGKCFLRYNIMSLIQAINNSSITTLDIVSNALGAAGAAEIAKLTKLTTLNLRSNNLGDAEAIEIAKLPNLTTLDVATNRIGAAGAIEIAKLPNLTTLNIASNLLGAAVEQQRLLSLLS